MCFYDKITSILREQNVLQLFFHNGNFVIYFTAISLKFNQYSLYMSHII